LYIKIHVKIQIVSFMCLCAIKRKHYSDRVPIVGAVGYDIGSSAASGSTLLVLRQFRVGTCGLNSFPVSQKINFIVQFFLLAVA